MFRVVQSLVLLVAFVVISPPAGGQERQDQPEHMSLYGRSTVNAADRTDAGEWSGTWFYVNKQRKMALWIRPGDDGPRLKIRSNEKGRNLLTNWDGQASYSVGSRPGEFSITFEQRDDNLISGSWVWTVGDEERGWKETADFQMYRSGRGRHLVMRIDNLAREENGRPSQRVLYQIWNFRKASRRQALWGELPF